MPKAVTQSSDAGAREGAPANARRPTILIIDDDDIARSLMRELLSPHCRVVELNSPIGASRTASAEAVDAVLLDVLMPNLRGDVLAKLFRTNPRLHHIGVILVSSCEESQLAELGRVCGADEIVAKRELRTQIVQTVLRVAIQARRRAAEAK